MAAALSADYLEHTGLELDNEADEAGRYLLPPPLGKQLAPHELFSCINLTLLARDHEATLVHSLEELDALRRSRSRLQRLNVSGRVRSAVNQALSFPDLVLKIARQAGTELKDLIGFDFDSLQQVGGLRPLRGQINGFRAVETAGWAAGNFHIKDSLDGCDVPTAASRDYDKINLNRDIWAAAISQAEGMIYDGVPSVLHGHSQGGLVDLLTALILESIGLGHLAAALVLVSPTSNGPAPMLQRLIELGGQRIFPQLAGMVRGSKEIQAWQTGLSSEMRARVASITGGTKEIRTSPTGLSPEMRARTVVIQCENGGDGVTTLNNSIVPGAPMIITPSYAHESAGRTPKRNTGARVARAVIGSLNTAYHRYSLAS